MYCRTFIAVGTSLTVHPAAGLVAVAAKRGARIVILNDAETPYDPIADEVIRDPIGQVLPELVPTTARS
jgi:NAD-dependent deacetylase